MKSYGTNLGREFPLFAESLPDFSALDQVSLPSAHTVLLIAVNARGIPTNAISRAAERLLASGLIYVCVWGPNCERVHDIFDEVHVGDGTTEPSFTFMSTWHDDEPLEEAVWFFLQSAFPPDGEIASTSYLAITVGNPDWAATVDQALSNLAAFKAKMLDEKLIHTLT